MSNLKVSNWSLAGMIAGWIFAVTSIMRYDILYPDIDRFVAYTTIGVLIIAVSWLYNKTLNLSNQITAMGDYLADKK